MGKNSSPFLDFSDFLILCKNNKIKKVVIYNNFLKCFLKDARHPQKLLKDIAQGDATGISAEDTKNISKTNDSTALVINSNDNTLENLIDNNGFPHQGHWKDSKNNNPANGPDNGIIDGIGQRDKKNPSEGSHPHHKDQKNQDTPVLHNDIVTGVGKCQSHSSGNPHGLGTEQENHDIINEVTKSAEPSNHDDKQKSAEPSNHNNKQQAINTDSTNHSPSKDHYTHGKTQWTNHNNNHQWATKNKDTETSNWTKDSQEFIKSAMPMDKMEDLLKLKNAYMVYFPKNYFNFVEIILPYTKINFDTMGFLGDYFWIYYFFPMMFNKFDNGR